MALPATSTSSSTLSCPRSQPNWPAEHTQPSHRNTPQGQKRRADEVDDTEDRSNNIYTNFKRLRINNNVLPARPASAVAYPDSHASITSHPAYHPPAVDSLDHSPIHHPQPSLRLPSHHQHAPHDLQTHLHPLHAHLSPNRDFTHTPPPAPYLHHTSTTTTLSDEPMTLDIDPPLDPNKVVINDLSAELAEIEAEERREAEQAQEREFFLPDDIEDQISGVPAHILRNSSSNKPQVPDSQALILYKPITSLIVPEEDDAVKKAVLEARKRMRERQRSPPPPSPYSDHDIDLDDSHDRDPNATAEPYIRNGFTADHPYITHGDRDSGRPGRFTREETPFPFPNPNVRQPILSAPYLPLGMEDDEHVSSNHDYNIDDWERERCDWDDAMDIE